MKFLISIEVDASKNATLTVEMRRNAWNIFLDRVSSPLLVVPRLLTFSDYGNLGIRAVARCRFLVHVKLIEITEFRGKKTRRRTK